MQIIIKDPKPDEPESITLNVRQMTAKIARAIEILKSPDDLTVYLDDQAIMLPIHAIFYAETIDQKTFIYAEKEVYRSRLKLYEVEEHLQSSDFLRISKQVIVSVKKIRSVAPAGEGRFAAKLINDEVVMISRQFVPAIKRRFGL